MTADDTNTPNASGKKEGRENSAPRAPEDLEHQSILYEHLLNSIPDIVYKLDGQGRILYINDAVCHYGYEPGELLGGDILELVHPDDRGKALHRINERRSGSRSTCALELRLLTKDKREVPFELKGNWDNNAPVLLIDAAGIYSGEPSESSFLATQGVARDITDRRRAERALNQSEKQFRSLVETAPIPVLVSRREGGEILFVNEALCAAFGMAEGELLGRCAYDFSADEQRRLDLTETIRRSGQVEDWEIQVKNARGSLFWASMWSRPVRFDGEEAMLSGFFDITTRKRAEEALRQVERLRVMSEVAGGAAHEINQPLTGILLVVEHLLYNEHIDGKLREALETISAQATRIGEIVTNMKNAQHYETRPYTLNTRVVDWKKAALDETGEAFRENPHS